MKVNNNVKRSRSSVWLVSLFVILALMLAGCGDLPIDPSSLGSLPFLDQIFPPTPTFTPTPIPTPTPTPEPTPTPKPGETPLPPTPTPIPTPQVTVPQGFNTVVDENLGYSFAIPRGWSELDLRSSQFQNMANTFGMGAQLAPMYEFLDSEEGQMVGKIYVTDLMQAMFGGLPTLLNVSVADAPDAEPETTKTFLEDMLKANASMLGDVEILNMSTATINNLPGLRGSAIADLSAQGMDVKLFAKVTALIANDKIYVLTLATQDSSRADKEPVFDQIAGTFRPE